MCNPRKLAFRIIHNQITLLTYSPGAGDSKPVCLEDGFFNDVKRIRPINNFLGTNMNPSVKIARILPKLIYQEAQNR